MPKLSLYRPEKGNDFKFLDRNIEEQFQVGGVDCFIHKYLGPTNPADGESTPSIPTQTNDIPELGIQDILFGENRDRRYDPDVYVLRGIYSMQDVEFNLSQFGLFLQNDVVLMHFHLRSSVENFGRKLMAGDVIELPHLKDEYALDTAAVALKRFYVIQDVTRPANGFSQTWYPHLIRAKCVPLVDSQEFSEILDADLKDADGNDTGSSLRDLISQYNTNIEINDQILAQADADAAMSGYDTTHMYAIPLRPDGTIDVADASIDDIDVSLENIAMDASIVLQSPTRNVYIGYLTGDGIPPNGAPFASGVSFPSNPVKGQFHLRTDHMPNRLYRFDGSNWINYENNVRMTLNNSGTDNTKPRYTQKAGFINNNNTATIAGEVVQERQALSKALRPKADI
jgi:hypothetical protein